MTAGTRMWQMCRKAIWRNVAPKRNLQRMLAAGVCVLLCRRRRLTLPRHASDVTDGVA